ncbi:hypothetical protein PCANC_00678 [Puccinia coronata f. sp. avenae]|uniref:Uncharacterized protein n=1 Tax=Puccinia coronata f. sp. avenae TaxID=200324 RepID=A0A2N5W6X7_9BASI|nr:hypothetical protein PCANC_00678 [Puccinia coronata f. sp. avenae]
MAASKFLSDAAIRFKLRRAPPSESLTHSNSAARAFGHQSSAAHSQPLPLRSLNLDHLINALQRSSSTLLLHVDRAKEQRVTCPNRATRSGSLL